MEVHIGKNIKFSSIRMLIYMLKQFPDYIYITNNELHYMKKILVDKMKCEKKFIMVSFERSLKHAGFKVIQTTHGEENIKKWVLQSKEEMMIPVKRRIYVNINKDDDYEP